MNSNQYVKPKQTSSTILSLLGWRSEDIYHSLKSSPQYWFSGIVLVTSLVLGSGSILQNSKEKIISNEVQLITAPGKVAIEQAKKKKLEAIAQEKELSQQKFDQEREISKQKYEEATAQINRKTKQKTDKIELEKQEITNKFELQNRRNKYQANKNINKQLNQEFGGKPGGLITNLWCHLAQHCFSRLETGQFYKSVENIGLDENKYHRNKIVQEQLNTKDNEIFEIITQANKQKQEKLNIHEQELQAIDEQQAQEELNIKEKRTTAIQDAVNSEKQLENKTRKEFVQKRGQELVIWTKASATKGSLIGATFTLLLIIIAAEKLNSSEKMWFRTYKLFVLRLTTTIVLTVFLALCTIYFHSLENRWLRQVNQVIILPQLGLSALVASVFVSLPLSAQVLLTKPKEQE